MKAVGLRNGRKAEVLPREVWSEDKKTQATLWASIYEGALTTIFLTWTSGAVITGYMLYLGASALQLATIGAVPMLAQASAPFAAYLLSVLPRPKLLTVLFSLLGRTIWLLPALMVFLPMPEGFGPLFLIAVMAFSFLFQAACGTIWSVWMGAVVPEEQRGRYFGFRTGLLSVVGLCASLSAGIFLDSIPAPYNYTSVLFVGVLMALGGIYLYGKHHVPEIETTKLEFRRIFMVPLQDQNFRKFLKFLVYWQLSIMLAASFVYPYMLDHLQLSFAQIAVYQAIAAVTVLIVGPRWGKVADKVGNKAVLAMTTFIAGSALPLCWILATPGDPTMIWISGIVDGLAWSAIHPAIFNLSLATAPKATRGAYLGILSLFSGVAGFAGGMISAPMLEMFKTTAFAVAGFDWTAYHTLFLVSALFRMQAWRFIRPVNETRAWRTRDVLRAARQYRFAGYFWR